MPSGKVLVIDSDSDIDELVRAVLTDAGYEITILTEMLPDAIAAVVGRVEPDAILLDGEDPSGFGSSWEHAAAIAKRERQIAVMMFSAHGEDLAEARADVSERTKAARLAGVIPKPFDLDELLDTVARAVSASEPFDTSAEADAERTRTLVTQLERIGARDARGSTRREWVTFRTPRERVIQV
ncbi:MAG TPA: response regulator [Candidatus Limnocylindria bacterium]